MAFFTRPRLNDIQFRQETNDNLTLSGTTYFPIVNGLRFGTSGTTASSSDIRINLTSPSDGDALVYSGGTIIFGEGGGGGFLSNLSGGTGLIASAGTSSLRTLSGGTGIDIITSGNVVTISSNGGTIGAPDDNDYTDGLFTSWTASTTIGNAVDDINEFLGLLSPAQPPVLRDQNTTGSFVAGKLSFGTDNDIVGYEDVVANFNGGALNTNDNFPATLGSDRKGLTQGGVAGILNDDVTDGDSSGIPYRNDAFKDGATGILELELNGVVIDTANLETGQSGVSGLPKGYLQTSQAYPVKFDNGNDLGSLVYRTGTFIIPTDEVELNNGYNYVRVIHSSPSFSQPRITNYTNWVYDPNSQAIIFTASNGTEFESVDFNDSNTRFVSGVEYYTEGTVTYQGVANNVYKNVYSNSSVAITFPTSVNLNPEPASISVVGSGIVNGSSRALPNLNTSVIDAQNTNITITSVLDIDTDRVLGNKTDANSGSFPSGELRANIDIKHPFTIKGYAGSTLTEKGVLFYRVTQPTSNWNENFDAETDRIFDRDYSTTSFASVNTNYNWIPEQSLTGTSAQHNTGLLVFNGALYYPNSTRLNDEYAISNGRFNALKYVPNTLNPTIGNANYSSINGVRTYYKRFRSGNPTTLSRLIFNITHTGSGSDFLTVPASNGTQPTGEQIRFEFIIKRPSTSTLPYANPFSTDFNAQGGVSNVGGFIQGGGITRVEADLGVSPSVVGQGDIVIVKLSMVETYTNKITNINIENIV